MGVRFSLSLSLSQSGADPPLRGRSLHLHDPRADRQLVSAHECSGMKRSTRRTQLGQKLHFRGDGQEMFYRTCYPLRDEAKREAEGGRGRTAVSLDVSREGSGTHAHALQDQVTKSKTVNKGGGYPA